MVKRVTAIYCGSVEAAIDALNGLSPYEVPIGIISVGDEIVIFVLVLNG